MKKLLGTAFFLLAGSSLPAAYILTEVSAGSVSIDPASSNFTQNISVLTVNRAAMGFGSHTSTVEGVYFTYSFLAPSGNFDAQNQMGGLWSGWGDPTNGVWQNGPTTAYWNRSARFQHMYPGGTPTSTYGSTPGADLTVALNNDIAVPTAGDMLSVETYLNAVDNTLFYVYRNQTTGTSFTQLLRGANIPTTSTLSFNNILFRSDPASTGLKNFSYTYGTLVVPEPSRAFLGAFALLLPLRRKRNV